MGVFASRLRRIIRPLVTRGRRGGDEALTCSESCLRRHRDRYAVRAIQDNQPTLCIGNPGDRLCLWRGRIVCHHIIFHMEGIGPASPSSI